MRRALGTALGLLVLIGIVAPSAMAADCLVYRKAVGGLSASYLYMTYAYIGVTADGYSKNVHQAEQVKVMMDETIGFLNNLVRILDDVQKSGAPKEDADFIQKSVDILRLLRSEAEFLSAFATTGDPADVEKFETARKTVWPKIKSLLAIK